MKLFTRKDHKTRGQTMVEFALVLPILLVTLYGVMEFGRLLLIYVTTASSSREAARYAAAIGISDNGVEYYNDCAGIRASAQRVGILASIQDSDITIQYDRGPGTTPYDTCPADGSGPGLGDRILVTVTGHFEPIVPFERLLDVTPISIRDIQSVTARTMVRNVTVGENFVPPPVTAEALVSPYVFFSEPSIFVDEFVGTVQVRIETNEAIPDEYGTMRVEIDVLDVYEASSGYDYATFEPYNLYFNPGEQYGFIPVNINNDPYFENYERIILYISGVYVNEELRPNQLGFPRFHIIRIIPDPADPMPTVYFPGNSSSVVENWPDGGGVQVRLSAPSGAPGWVNFTLTGTSDVEGEEPQPGIDYTFAPNTGQLYFATSPTGARLTSTTGNIWIYPINNLEDDPLRQIDIQLVNPFNLILPDLILNPDWYTRHTVTLIDDEDCAFVENSLMMSGDHLAVDLVNNGLNDNISWVNLLFSSDVGTTLQRIELADRPQLWSGNVGSPVVIPSAGLDWSNPAELDLNADGVIRTLHLRFSDMYVSQIDSFTLGFDICPPISFSNILNPYPAP
jgi:Flp pilus assembly protein TadG